MPSYKTISNKDIPDQVTSPDSGSKPFPTDKDGVVYPKELKRVSTDYLSGEGSMGFDRNQGVVREGWIAPEVQGGTMGQHKLQKVKDGGSHAI